MRKYVASLFRLATTSPVLPVSRITRAEWRCLRIALPARLALDTLRTRLIVCFASTKHLVHLVWHYHDVAMHRFLYFPQNLLMGLYNAYYAPSDLSTGMRMLIAALPATFNKSWVISLSEDQLVQYAHMVGQSLQSAFPGPQIWQAELLRYLQRSSDYPTPPPAPAGVSISTTNEFNDLLEDCDGEWRFHVIKPTTASTSSEPAFMIYLHGGAYVSTAQPSHFTFLYDLCQRTGVTILMPIYPRPPHAKVSHKDILGVMTRVTERLRGTAGQSTGEATAAARKAIRFSVAGDSAGGGMAMGLVLSLIKNKRESLLPSLLLLNAPWMDVSLSSSEMDKYDKMVSLLQDKFSMLELIVFTRPNRTPGWPFPSAG